MITFPVVLGILLRGFTDISGEGPDEVGVGMKTGTVAGVLNVKAGTQEFLGFYDPKLDRVFHDAEISAVFKHVTQVMFAHGEMTCQLIQGKGFLVYASDVIHDGGYLGRVRGDGDRG